MGIELRSYLEASRRVRLRIAAALAVVAGLLAACGKAHLPVPWWTLFLFLLAAMVGGVAYPAYFRLRQHPRRTETAERRYALAQLVGRPLGFALVVAGALATAMKTQTAITVAPYLILGGTFLASISIFFRYQGWDDAA